jgi:hypothetical protein
MKLEDVFFIGGLVFIGYWLTRKNPTIITSENTGVKPFIKEEEPKTIVIDLNKTQNSNSVLNNSVVRDYKTAIQDTVSPLKVYVKDVFQ